MSHVDELLAADRGTSGSLGNLHEAGQIDDIWFVGFNDLFWLVFLSGFLRHGNPSVYHQYSVLYPRTENTSKYIPIW